MRPLKFQEPSKPRRADFSNTSRSSKTSATFYRVNLLNPTKQINPWRQLSMNLLVLIIGRLREFPCCYWWPLQIDLGIAGSCAVVCGHFWSNQPIQFLWGEGGINIISYHLEQKIFKGWYGQLIFYVDSSIANKCFEFTLFFIRFVC